MTALGILDRHLIQLSAPDDFNEWRDAVRSLLAGKVRPEYVDWHVIGMAQEDLFASSATVQPNDVIASHPARQTDIKVSRELLSLLKTAMLHSDAGRFALGYRILWRLREQPFLPQMTADADMIALHKLAKSVRRDIHKMHAFVRFRKVGQRESSSGVREIFLSWFEPEHHVTRSVAGFFRDRFNGMDWTIITPEARISWNGENLDYGTGGTRDDAPADDAVEEEWRRYYASIFNPARVKPKAMKSEMPVKYWKNLPEAELISPLLKDASVRTRDMVAQGQGKAAQRSLLANVEAETAKADFATLTELNAYMLASDEAPSAGFSSRIVVGEGEPDAQIMLLGEQPGDQEDVSGRVFVGPAGQLLDDAMQEAGLDRERLYLTNAVKRFKYDARGPRRIHRTPSQADVSHYRVWLMQEIALVRPRLIVALGATALLALTGKRHKLSAHVGNILPLSDGVAIMAAYHPSYLLRLPDEEGRRIEYDKLVRHLKKAKEFANR